MRRVLPATILVLAALAGCGQSDAPGGPPSAPASTASPSATVGASTPVPTDAPSLPISPTPALTTAADVPFTPPVACSVTGPPSEAECRLGLDVVAPTTGGPWPLLVLLRGGPDRPNGQNYLLPFAEDLAARGAVAIVADWRQTASFAGGYPAGYGDVSCAIGVARRIAPEYGAEPGHVTLVGHSLGGWAAAVLGLAPAPLAPDRGSCDETAGSLRPDAVATLDANVDGPTNPDAYQGIVGEVLGGSREERPDAWAAADPFTLLERQPAGPGAPNFLVVHGADDRVVAPEVSHRFHEALGAAGYRSSLVIVPGGHNAALTTPQVIDPLLALRPD